MSQRELIDTGTDKRYVRWNEDGAFKDERRCKSVVSQDARQHAETKRPRSG